MRKSKQAYGFVDLSVLSEEDRQAVMDDAAQGGGEYGVVIVEEHINGPAVQPIYGVYFGEQEDKWKKALVEDFGIADAPAVVAEDDEDAARAAAAASADASADAVNAAEDAELRRIVGDDEPKPNKAKR